MTNKKTYYVIGMGKAGLATALWFKEKQYPFVVWDDQERNLPFNYLPLDQIHWDTIKCVVMSPGIPLTHPIPLAAKSNNIPCITDIDLLQQEASYANYIGITGTNGKSTTSALTHHILKASGRTYELGGNIGIPALSLPVFGKDQTYILELSSFYLEISTHLNLKTAALINLTPDHLDRHGTMDNYLQAKVNIFNDAEHKIIGLNQPILKDWFERQDCKDQFFTIQNIESLQEIKHKGLYIYNHCIFNDAAHKIFEITEHPFLKGDHNAENIAFSIAICLFEDLPVDEIIENLMTFKGLAHRQQHIRTLKNIHFINDSKGTNAESTEKALNAFSNIYWILGGKAKTEGIDILNPFFNKIKKAYLIGEATERFSKTLEGQLDFVKSHTLEKAIQQAYADAKNDENEAYILLSPACASYDQYKNFEERGEHFCHLVETL